MNKLSSDKPSFHSHYSTTTKKRGRDGTSPRLSPVPDVLFQTAAIQASQVCSKFGYHGLAQLLMSRSNGLVPASASSNAASSNSATDTSSSGAGAGAGASSSSSNNNVAGLLPTIAQVQQAATKAHQEQPPWIHWSKSDMAHASMRVTSGHRLELQGNLSSNATRSGGLGYRMARANVGCHAGSHYFEIWVQDKTTPTTADILQALPPTVRLAPGLRWSLQAAVEYDERKQQPPVMPVKQPPAHRQSLDLSEKSSMAGESSDVVDSSTNKRLKSEQSEESFSRQTSAASSHKDQEPSPRRVGGHLRVGWSMRTGELQAPVGYDRWSFAIRDIGGSIITNSQRIDNWVGAEGFGPGDVIGCAISLEDVGENDKVDDDPDAASNNSIRFFKNGICMGEFVIAKGKRSGGEAPFHNDIPAGTYYPAVSCYLGGSVRANFGPKFLYPPRKLPAGLKLAPLSDLAAAPEKDPQVVMAQMTPIIKYLRTSGWKNPDYFQQVLQQAVQAEARILNNMYESYHRQNLLEIRKEREERGLATQDLETLLEGKDKGD